MTTTTTPETRIEADPALPTIRIVREFDAPPAAVFRAFTDPEVFVRWLGPTETSVRLDRWDAVSGGSYRYTMLAGEEEVVTFWGSFHEVRSPDRLVQTQSMEGIGDGAILNTVTFTDLGDGRTRMTDLTVAESFEGRDMILASGMDEGVIAGYKNLDALLAEN
ncbi:MAG: polyketide cyclase [Actinophytocola sp.]|uniref:SRPBCC family protein n=1 Tax=Actinophytocola sp. TaxID=1872138 RepID=UPI0013255F23|nr:SRPBCC family protein [Actinophytocola sp.]MPZ79974.1 polyketide cyclase [Actinophytocola sp.]